MDYLKKSFSVGALPTERYRNEWERIFGKPTGGICDHCKGQGVDLISHNRLWLCSKCAGLPPKVATFWTCPDCGGPAAWEDVQLHRCPRRL